VNWKVYGRKMSWPNYLGISQKELRKTMKLLSGYLFSRPIYEPRTFRIRSRGA
jgi:hypothetical protein